MSGKWTKGPWGVWDSFGRIADIGLIGPASTFPVAAATWPVGLKIIRGE